MSTLDVVAEVLREVAPRALKARQIAELAGSRLTTASRTPETVVSRDLALDVKKLGARSRFLRVDRGTFVLKESLPTAFYNDNDAYAAAWTRNLIAAGEIAAGVVDERSIRDLKPADVASYRQCHFFSGIGVWSRALRDAGWPDNVHVWSGSCPCTPFSSAGRKRGFSDEQHLWPEWYWLIDACRPALIVGEQVSSKDGLAWLDLVRADLENANYGLRVLDIPAACAGAPHARHRLYFAAYARERSSEIIEASWLRERAVDAQNKLARAVDARDVAYARERGREILGASWLHDRRQSGHDALGRCATHSGVSGTIPDAAGARSRDAQDIGADRGDAFARTEAYDRRSAWDLESQRSGDADGAGPLSDAERVVWDERRIGGSHGWAAIELDRHGEADGADGLGDAGLARGRRDAGEVSRAQEAGEGERIEARDLTDELVAPGAADGAALARGSVLGEEELVRGAADVAGDDGGDESFVFKPGDRIRLSDDPTWGGAVRGYWAEDVEWIYCRPEPGHQDGRWRPTRAGIEPLADGPAAGVGRTRAKRLRGYGNAIVRPLAVVFIEAVIEAFVDAVGVLDFADAVRALGVPSAPPAPTPGSVADAHETREEDAA